MFNVGIDSLILGIVINAYLIGVIFRILLLKSNYSLVQKIFYMPVEITRIIKDYKADRMSKLEILLIVIGILLYIYVIFRLSYYATYTELSYYFVQLLVIIVFYNITALKFYFIRRVK